MEYAEDEQLMFEEMRDEDEHRNALVSSGPRIRGSYKPDSMAIYQNAGFPEFVSKIAEIGQEARNNGYNAESMYTGLMKYIKLCQDSAKPLGWQAAYMAMGINRKIAYDIMHGRSGDKDKRQVVALAQQLCSINLESMMASNLVNPIIGIFWQKVHDGFSESAEANMLLVETNRREQQNSEDVVNKYLDMPD